MKLVSPMHFLGHRLSPAKKTPGAGSWVGPEPGWALLAGRGGGVGVPFAPPSVFSRAPSRMNAGHSRRRSAQSRAPEADPATATAWLAKHASEQPERLLAQAGGAPLLALALADPVVQREREVLLAELARPERFSPLALGARLEAAARDERKTRLGEALYWLLTWTADLAAVASGGAPRFNPERREALSRLSAQVARVPLFRYYQALLRQRALLNHPLQPRLVAEALLFEYRGLFAKGKS